MYILVIVRVAHKGGGEEGWTVRMWRGSRVGGSRNKTGKHRVKLTGELHNFRFFLFLTGNLRVLGGKHRSLIPGISDNNRYSSRKQKL